MLTLWKAQHMPRQAYKPPAPTPACEETVPPINIGLRNFKNLRMEKRIGNYVTLCRDAYDAKPNTL